MRVKYTSTTVVKRIFVKRGFCTPYVMAINFYRTHLKKRYQSLSGTNALTRSRRRRLYVAVPYFGDKRVRSFLQVPFTTIGLSFRVVLIVSVGSIVLGQCDFEKAKTKTKRAGDVNAISGLVCVCVRARARPATLLSSYRFNLNTARKNRKAFAPEDDR